MVEVTLELGLKNGQNGTIQGRYVSWRWQIMENTGKEVALGKECERRHRSRRGCAVERTEADSGNQSVEYSCQKRSISGSALVNSM